MRTKKEFEDERYFGIQKFTEPMEAFKVMEGRWGESGMDTQTDLLILTDETFRKAILIRAIEKYAEYKNGKISWEECSKALGTGNEVSDYLLDFDFFLYSKLTKNYYTCRMSFKDDHVTQWNDRQWEYYEELSEFYSFDMIIEKAKSLIDPLCEDERILTEEDLETLYMEEGLFL